MEITWRRSETRMLVTGREIPCSCRVKNELNGLRNDWSVVHGELEDGTEGPPFQPRQFPLGRWKVTGIHRRTHPYLRPFFIATEAFQEMPAWTVHEGVYEGPSRDFFMDYGYGIHCSASPTTLGCVRVDDEEHLTMLIVAIRNAWTANEDVYFDVTD